MFLKFFIPKIGKFGTVNIYYDLVQFIIAYICYKHTEYTNDNSRKNI